LKVQQRIINADNRYITGGTAATTATKKKMLKIMVILPVQC